MAKSCKGLAMELVKCLSESDCVKVENKSYRECAGEKMPSISTECVGLKETYFNCKRGQVLRSPLLFKERGLYLRKGLDVIQQAQSGIGKTAAPSALITSRCLYWMRLMKCSQEPDRPDEMDRVEAAGGRVINWNGYRVLGVLATSRSIGDQYFKPYVISVSEVNITERMEKDEFVILASDGLYDVISNEMACQVVRHCRNGQIGRTFANSTKESDAVEVAAVLAELAMAQGSKDNISVVAIELSKSS
ncbi:hypothetical protein IFM89_034162 [Coptis chinensis]|uniref:PPM-type phosphatase domain-containing protein n=1 Tax=Coptis chinensis TaxID=261450 RepID=A0A835HRK7_9MAGN|nr:hypothetical protein IFM89_034162 [Coptis chinensis]